MPSWIKNSFLINVIFLLLVFLTAYGAFKLVREAKDINKESQKLEERAAKLVLRNQELGRNLAELETEEAVEKRAKERLNLKLPGEQVVVVAPASSTGVAENHEEQLSGFDFILDQWTKFLAKISASWGF